MVYHVRKNFKEQYAQQPKQEMQVPQQPMQVQQQVSQQPMQELPRIEKKIMKAQNPRFLQAEIDGNSSDSNWFDINKEWVIPVLILIFIILLVAGYFIYTKYYKGKGIIGGSSPEISTLGSKPNFYYF